MSDVVKRLVTAAALAAVLSIPDGLSAQSVPSGPPAVVGLDHIPLAVADLDAAAARYRQLGFTLKPGRPHDNGIRNVHAKFADGTEIELITASRETDALTAEYRKHLARGDGPAFVAFYAPEVDAVARRLAAAGRTYRRAGALLDFPESSGLRHIFFGRRNRSPTDRPEHFAHANGAEALVGVWLAGDDLRAERDLMIRLGASIAEAQRHVPDPIRVPVASLPQGEVVFLPGARQWAPGRRIVGATLRTRDLSALRRVLENGPWKTPDIVRTAGGSSVFLPPEVALGLWLEFRQP